MANMDINFEIDGELFVWNEFKAKGNWRKHGINFEEAATVFFDPLLIIITASRNNEERDAVIGFDSSGRLLYVVHIEIEETSIRIISARRAEPNEESTYAF